MARNRSTRSEPLPNPGNLNDLNSKEFTKHKRSWVVIDAKGEPEWKELKRQHSATFPRAVARWLMECYTKEGMTVLDPMMGSGSTVVEAGRFGREAIGIDLYTKYVQMALDIIRLHKDREEIPEKWDPHIWGGDAIGIVRNMLEDESVHYIMFSPPYANFLHRSSGGVQTRHKDRQAEGLDTTYGDHAADIGNVDPLVWEAYLVALAQELYRVMVPGRIMTIIVQNEMRTHLNPIAWRLGLAIHEQTDWLLLPEQIWCQSEKPVTIHGWPTRLVINNHHHYWLNFEKPGEPPPQGQGTLARWKT